MRYMSPHKAVRDIYLDDKSAPRYRETGRLLPRFPISSGRDILFFVDGEALSWQMYLPFWKYVQENPQALEEAKHATIVGFPVELRVLEMSLQAEIERPGEKSFLVKARDKCVKQMFAKFTEERGMDESLAFRELALRFREPHRTLYRIVRGRKEERLKDIRYYRKALAGDPRLEVLYKALLRARVLAANKRQAGEAFGLDDLLPYHPGSAAQYLPPVCPVLGFKLDYTPGGRAVQSVRVGRKDASKPYGPKNVAVMSRLAARMIEGSIAVETASLAMDPEMGYHWREWTRVHSSLLGKTPLGRPVGTGASAPSKARRTEPEPQRRVQQEPQEEKVVDNGIDLDDIIKSMEHTFKTQKT